MCGICGMVSLNGAPLATPDLLDAMGAALRHRGPDGYASHRAPSAAFGAARLRVVDLDPRADQPFTCPDGSVWLACNGEIYNAPELRRRFASYPFKSRSDCEVILPLYEAGGSAALADLDGMFALSLWDTRTSTLTLARDRAGEKPLFYAQVGSEFWFASEIPALLLSPALSRAMDDAALADYLRSGYVSEPRTMFRGVRQVRPGTIHTFSATGSREHAYWDLTPRAAPAERDPVDALRSLLPASVSRQVTADVPVGVFLSGGVDSATVAALAARSAGPDRVRAYSVGFEQHSFDERSAAASTAQHLGLAHEVVTASDVALMDAFDTLARTMAEPLADPALLPTYLLAKRARESVTVVLGGEGADELFGGYPTYQAHRAASRWRRLPRGVRATVAGALRAWPVTHGRLTTSYLLRRFTSGAELPWPERHHAWFGTGLPADIGPVEPGITEDPGPDIVRAARLLDFRTYLRDDLLVKLDRATMRVGLEARAPFLDRGVVEFALGLTTNQLLRGLTDKWVLRRAADAWLPRSVTRRAKRGLSVPVSAWINGSLTSEVDRLLDLARLRRQGVLSHLSVARLLREHRERRADHGRALWALIVLQLWLERYGGGTA